MKRILMSLYTALLRVLKNPLFIVMLLFLGFCVVFFGSIEKEVSLPKAGIVLRDSDEQGMRLYDALVKDGFKPYENEDGMREAIRVGEISVGVAIKKDLTKRLMDADVEGCIVLYCMPTTSFVNVTSLRVSAQLAEIYAPYITNRLMENRGLEISIEDVREYMDYCYEHDAQFEFVFSDMEGKELVHTSYSKSLIWGMFAVLLFCLFSLCTCTEKDAGYRELRDRLGYKKAFFTVLLPSYTVKYLITFLMVLVSSFICQKLYGTDISGLYTQCAIYLLYLCGIGALLYALLYKFSRVQLYIIALSLISLGICPIFVDISNYAVIPDVVKLALLPPYFFYKIPSSPVLYLIIAGFVCAAGLIAIYIREARTSPRTRL